MKQNVLIIILSVLCVVLAMGYFRIKNESNQMVTAPCPAIKELEQLKFEKSAWEKYEQELLEQNAALVKTNDSLFQKLNTKIVYKNAKTPPSNAAASKYYTDILSKRYSN